MLNGNRIEAHLGKNHKISEQFDRKTSGSLQTHGNLLLLESQLSDKRLRTNTTSQTTNNGSTIKKVVVDDDQDKTGSRMGIRSQRNTGTP